MIKNLLEQFVRLSKLIILASTTQTSSPVLQVMACSLGYFMFLPEVESIGKKLFHIVACHILMSEQVHLFYSMNCSKKIMNK